MDDWPDDFQHFSPSMRLRATAIEKAVAAERERCAKIAESEPEMPGKMPTELHNIQLEGTLRAVCRATKKSIAAAIRSGA